MYLGICNPETTTVNRGEAQVDNRSSLFFQNNNQINICRLARGAHGGGRKFIV